MFKAAHLLLGMLIGIPSIVAGREVMLIDPTGASIPLSINPNHHFEEVVDDLASYVRSVESSSEPVILKLLVTDKALIVKSQGNKRDYHLQVNSKEKKDIDFIITTMAWESVKKLWDLESDLNKAGDRILHLHPLKFLEAICTDEKLCVGLKAIRQRNILVWPRFIKGNIKTLEEEQKTNNVVPFVEEFSKTIGVDSKYLLPLANKGKWKEFVETVVDKVPRANNPNRYDM